MIQSQSLIFDNQMSETSRQLFYSNKDVTVNIFNLIGDIFLWGLAISAAFYLTRAEKI